MEVGKSLEDLIKAESAQRKATRSTRGGRGGSARGGRGSGRGGRGAGRGQARSVPRVAATQPVQRRPTRGVTATRARRGGIRSPVMHR